VLTDVADRQSFCMDQGAMTPPYLVPAAVLDDARWLHVGTGDPAAYLPLAKQARKAGVAVAFDPSQEIHFSYDARHFEAMLETAQTFFCNDAELGRALAFLRYGEAAQLLDHLDTVVVTHGAGGASLHRSGHKVHRAPAVAARVVDPTGAGDALRAGWYAALAAGKDAEVALWWGQAAAAIVVGHAGAQEHVVRPQDLAATLAAAPAHDAASGGVAAPERTLK
jgi:adenosine kinase